MSTSNSIWRVTPRAAVVSNMLATRRRDTATSTIAATMTTPQAITPTNAPKNSLREVPGRIEIITASTW